MPPAPEHIPLRGRPQHVPIESSTPDSSHSQQPEPEPQLDSDLFLENDAASSSAQLLSRSRLAQEIVPTTVRDHRLGRNSLLVGHIPFDSCIDPFVDQPESWSSVQDILGLRQEAGHIVVYMRTCVVPYRTTLSIVPYWSTGLMGNCSNVLIPGVMR